MTAAVAAEPDPLACSRASDSTPAERIVEAFRHAGSSPDGFEDRQTLVQVLHQLEPTLPISAIECLLNEVAGKESDRVDVAALVGYIFQDALLCVESMYLRQLGVPCPSAKDVAYMKDHGVLDIVGDFVKGICSTKPTNVRRYGAEYFNGFCQSSAVITSAPAPATPVVSAVPAASEDVAAAAAAAVTATPKHQSWTALVDASPSGDVASVAGGIESPDASQALGKPPLLPGAMPSAASAVLPGFFQRVTAASDGGSRCSSNGVRSNPSTARQREPPQRQVSRSWSKRSDCGNLEAGEQGTVDLHVTMAASGEEACTVRLHRGATVAELRPLIREKMGVALVQQDLLANGRLLNNEAELIADVLHSLPDESDGVQLVVQPPEEFLEDVREMRKQLSREVNPPIQEAIDAGVVPRYIRFLEETTWPELQFEAGWALTNIASGSSEQTRVVVQHNALPRFVAQLDSPNHDVRAQAVWALANIAGDGPALRDEVLQAGVVGPMLDMFQAGQEGGPRRPDQLVWALSNLCRGIPRPAPEAVAPILERLYTLMHEAHNDEELVDVCWIASYLAEGPDERGHAVAETGCVPRLVELVGHNWSQVQTPALRALGNILTGADHDTQTVLDSGFLNALGPLLQHTRASIRKEACWSISNVMAGTKRQVQMVIDSRLVTNLVHILQDDLERREVKKEACFAICNAVSAKTEETRRQVAQLVELGCAEALIRVLRQREPGDVEAIVSVALEGVEGILLAGAHDGSEGLVADESYVARVLSEGGREVIEPITESQNSRCREPARRILHLLDGGKAEKPLSEAAAATQLAQEADEREVAAATPLLEEATHNEADEQEVAAAAPLLEEATHDEAAVPSVEVEEAQILEQMVLAQGVAPGCEEPPVAAVVEAPTAETVEQVRQAELEREGFDPVLPDPPREELMESAEA